MDELKTINDELKGESEANLSLLGNEKNAGDSTSSAQGLLSETPDQHLSQKGRLQEGIFMEQETFDKHAATMWRPALWVDGKLRWVEEGDVLGDPVPLNITYNFLQRGKYTMLEPKAQKAEENKTADQVEKSEDKDFDAKLDQIIDEMLREDPHFLDHPDPTTGGAFRSSTLDKLNRKYFKEKVKNHLAGKSSGPSEQGWIAVDCYGNFDLDHKNPGPELNPESQWIARGYLSMANVDTLSIFQDRERKTKKAFVPGSKTAGKILESKDSLIQKEAIRTFEEDPGYISSTSSCSDVSVDHCGPSSTYPACPDTCWLRSPPAPPDVPTLSELQPSMPSILSTDQKIYDDLNHGNTRVLRIKPGTQRTTIFCDLITIKIPGFEFQGEVDKGVVPHEYEALSYTWGKPDRTATISCNSVQVPVTQNLFDALTHLRHSDRERYLWVDAICINQDSIKERNEQVRQMLNIYKGASRVIVWLGDTSDDSEFAIAGMKYLDNTANRKQVLRHAHQSCCLENLQRLLDAQATLFQRPWFSRSWIRQEVSAAKTVTVCCGRSSLSWYSLKRSANRLWKLHEKLESERGNDLADFKVETPLKYLSSNWTLGQSLFGGTAADLRSIWYYHTGGLLDLLMIGRLFDATDPRDKVYSVLGMAQVPIENEKSVEPMPTMRIDYSQSIAEVYQYLVKFMINRDKNLDILSIISTHRDANSLDLPTWTPDWRVPISSIPLDTNFEYFTYKMGAAGFTEAEPQDQNDLGKLTARGFYIGAVTELLGLTSHTIPHPPQAPTADMDIFDPERDVRQFAIMECGMGLVPRDTQAGDRVWILYGSRLPMVLRRDESFLGELRFEVVGPCYLPGFMLGKAMKAFLDQEGNDDTIVLV